MEWNDLLGRISAQHSVTLDKKEITINKLISVDKNRCIPLINSKSVSYEIETEVCSVVCGSLGEYYYRFWLSKHGHIESISQLEQEVGNTNNVLHKFMAWNDVQNFDKYKSVGSMMITREVNGSFNVGILAAWIEENIPMVYQDIRDMKIKSRKDMDMLYTNSIKSWALASELIMLWIQNNAISANNGIYKLV